MAPGAFPRGTFPCLLRPSRRRLGWRRVVDVAEKEGADLIIIASHRPDFTNYLIGATADRVVRHATCSVLVDR